MAHMTTPCEAEERMMPLAERLTALGFPELASWLIDAARGIPYLTDETYGFPATLDAEITRIERLTGEGERNG